LGHHRESLRARHQLAEFIWRKLYLVKSHSLSAVVTVEHLYWRIHILVVLFEMFLVRLLETPSILFQGFFQVLFLFVEYLLSLLTRLILLSLAFGLIILEIDFLLDLFPLFKCPR